MLDIPRKNGLFTNLKKCRFHKNKVQFLGDIILSQGIWIDDEKIEMVKNWLEPKLVQDIQVFIGFANFYQCFIEGFSRIEALLTSILKMTGLSDLVPRLLGANKIIRGGGKALETIKNLSKCKKSKNAKSENPTHINTRAMRELIFLFPSTKRAFN